MRKKLSLTFALLFALMMIMSSCGGSFGTTDGCDEKGLTVEAKNAGKDMYFTTGTLVAGEGESIVFDAADLENGEIHFELIPADVSENPDELPDVEGAEALITANVAAGETQEYSLDPGSYMITAKVAEKATGNVVVMIRSDEPRTE